MIHVEDLTFTYPRSVQPAVSALNFTVEPGEIFGFLGPSGAGKSTTQNILVGLLRGWSGTVEVMGRPRRHWGRDFYRHVGVSFELPNHYLKLTARENLDYFRALYGTNTATADEVLTEVGLQEHGDKPVSAFSKGMKNRLTLARSLLNRPRLWFLDEPTSGLDPVNAVKVRELVKKRQSQGTTTLLTTHDMVVADALCDRVAFIVDGRLAECDTPESLKRRWGRREVKLLYGDEAAPQSRSFPMEGLGYNEDFLGILRQEHLVAMHSQETTLENVFVKVTGKALQ